MFVKICAKNCAETTFYLICLERKSQDRQMRSFRRNHKEYLLVHDSRVAVRRNAHVHFFIVYLVSLQTEYWAVNTNALA